MRKSIAILLLLLWCSGRISADTIDAEWLSAVGGAWRAANNWSTAPVYPNNGTPRVTDDYRVTISASGAPYVVSLDRNVAITSLLIDSPDATVSLDRGRFRVPEIEINDGVLVLGGNNSISTSENAILEGTMISGVGGELQLSPLSGASPVFDGVSLGVPTTLPRGLQSNNPRLTLRNGLELRNDIMIRVEDRGAILQIDGDQTISGQGSFVFVDDQDSFASGLVLLRPETTLTIGPDVAFNVSSMGGNFVGPTVDQSTVLNIGLVNHGVLSANSSEPIHMHLMNMFLGHGVSFHNTGVVEALGNTSVVVGGDWQNTGSFRVRDNAALYLGGRFSVDSLGNIDRQGGQIYISGELSNRDKVITANAMTGDLVLGRGAVSVSGPTVIDGGRIEAQDGATWVFTSSELRDVTLAADVSVPSSSRIDITGDLILDHATIRVTSGSVVSGAGLAFQQANGSQALRGQGTIEFVEGSASSISSEGEFRAEPGITIAVTSGRTSVRGPRFVNEGRVQVAARSTFELNSMETVNVGTMDVDGILQLGDSLTNESQWTNQGTIRLAADSRLNLAGKFEAEDIGTILAEGAATIRWVGELNNAGQSLDLEALDIPLPLTVNGGTLRGGELGESALPHLQVTNNMKLVGVTLTSDFPESFTGATLFVREGLTLDGTQTAFPARVNLAFDGTDPQLLGGNGTVVASGARIRGSDLTIGEGVTIRTGTVGFSETNLVFRENRGTIRVETPYARVNIGEQDLRWTNAGLIEVFDGTAVLLGEYFTDDLGNLQNHGGQIQLAGRLQNANNTLSLDRTTGTLQFRGQVHGGRVETRDGVFADLGGEFVNVTFAGNGNLYNHGASTDGGSLIVREALTLDGGTLTIAPGAQLRMYDTVRIGGTGEIVLSGMPTTAAIETYNGTTLTIEPGITIRTSPGGGGRISRANLPVINRGQIVARHAEQSLVVSGLENHGTLEAANGGRVVVENSNLQNPGTIRLNDGTIEITSSSFINAPTGLIAGHGALASARATLVNHGVIAPSSALGELRLIGSAELSPQSEFVVELSELYATEGFAALRVMGSLQLGGALAVTMAESFELKPNQSFTVITAMSGITGEFQGFEEGALVGNYDGADLFISYRGGQGSDVVLTTAIPEPTFGLIAVSLLGLGALGNRSRR